MATRTILPASRIIPLLIAICVLCFPAQAKYSGGTGRPEDPYQIATAEDLMLLGDSPEDYSQHFILTADIDLDPNLPGRKVLYKAVIAPDTGGVPWQFDGPAFAGVLDGNHHAILHLSIKGGGYLGLFGEVAAGAQVRNLAVVAANINGSGSYIGELAGSTRGTVHRCYATGTVTGRAYIGALVGENGGSSSAQISGRITECWSNASIRGENHLGGLVGDNGGRVTQCHSSGSVSGNDLVGGLVGSNGSPLSPGLVAQCYSTSAVAGIGLHVGGLVGYQPPDGSAAACFWDAQTSGQATSAGGVSKTTAEMQTAGTFLAAGWDFIGEMANGSADTWKIDEGLTYPRLSWEKYSGGTGEPNDPYQIATAADLIALGEASEDYDKHFILTADIDLDPNLPGGKVFDRAVIAPDTDPNDVHSEFKGGHFTGVFDGNAHTIQHLTINGKDYLGLFGGLAMGQIRDLGLVDIRVTGSGEMVAGLVAMNINFGVITRCYSTGVVSGKACVGGLVGYNSDTLTECYTTAIVSDALGLYEGRQVGCWPEGGK